MNTSDQQTAKDLKIEWALDLGPNAFRAIANIRKAAERLRNYLLGLALLAGIIGFILGFLLGSWEGSGR